MLQAYSSYPDQHSAGYCCSDSRSRFVASESTARDIQFYMSQIKSIPLLTLNEEKKLSRQIRYGRSTKIREQAKEQLITANLRLVVKIAFQFVNTRLSISDLIAEGNIGLIRAVEEYDPDKGAKFSYYAAWWIKLAIRRAILNQQEIIRLPLEFAERQRKYYSAYISFTEKFLREPTDSELAALMGCSVRVIKNIRTQSISTISLNAPVSSTEPGDLLLFLPDKNENNPDQLFTRREEVERLLNAMKTLNPVEVKILRMRFGFETGTPLTLETVSCKLGKTKERIRQIQVQAIQKLKEQLTEPAMIWQALSLAG